jgi:multiple sugar transport system permease protein
MGKLRKGLHYRTRDKIFGLALLLPAVILVGYFVFLSVLDSVAMSFQDFKLGKQVVSSWNSFAHYKSMFAWDGKFWHSLNVTFQFVLFTVAELVITGLLLSVYFQNIKKFARLWRSLILLSWGIPVVIVGLIWNWMFHSNYGLINFLFTSLGIIDKPMDWIMNASTALHTVVVAALWRQLPFVFLLLVAGIQGIPSDVYEAGAIDGVNPLQRIFHITLPYLRNVLRGCILISIITNFKLFPLFWTMTGGGPANLTETLAVLTYKNAFVNMNFGAGAAVSTGWLVTLVVFSIAYDKFFPEADY